MYPLQLSAVKEWFLDDYAARFQTAGFASLIYDNRCWGSSDGTPRNETDPWRQIEDIHAAVGYALTLPEVDPDQIIVWGSSGSGGNALTATALDPRVKAVISQVPFLSGEGAQLAAPKEAVLSVYANRDHSIPVQYTRLWSETVEEARNSDHKAILGTEESAQFYQTVSKKELPSDVQWENKISIQTYYHMFKHEPIQYIHRISPRPMLMVVAMKDSIIPPEVALKAFDKAGDGKELIKFDCGHFEPYQGEFFNRNIQVQIDFLKKHFP